MDPNYTPPPYPFFAASDILPAPLPTIEEIATSQDLLKASTGRRIVRVGPHFIVKYGMNVDLKEGQNMLFVRQNSAVPVPTLYALYSHHQEGKKRPTVYIVMENIAGESLESGWSSLDPTAKSDVARQLRQCFEQLRQIPSHGYFGGLGRQQFDHPVFWTDDEGFRRVFSGPFDSERQMLDAIVEKYRQTNRNYNKAEYYARVLPVAIKNHDPVFTHGDFQRKNVVRKSDGTVVIIDWEAAAWYPSYWEYVITLYACHWNDDWQFWVPKMLDEHLNEFGWMVMMFNELWC